MAIFINFQTTSIYLHPLQVENCYSNSRLEVDEDDNGKFRLERVNVVDGGPALKQHWVDISCFLGSLHPAPSGQTVSPPV